MIVPIVPHRSMWLVYGVFVGTVSTQTIVPSIVPPPRGYDGGRWGRSFTGLWLGKEVLNLDAKGHCAPSRSGSGAPERKRSSRKFPSSDMHSPVLYSRSSYVERRGFIAWHT